MSKLKTDDSRRGALMGVTQTTAPLYAAAITISAAIHATIVGSYDKDRALELERMKQRDATQAVYVEKMTALGSRAAVVRFVKTTSDDPALRKWAEDEEKRLGQRVNDLEERLIEKELALASLGVTNVEAALAAGAPIVSVSSRLDAGLVRRDGGARIVDAGSRAHDAASDGGDTPSFSTNSTTIPRSTKEQAWIELNELQRLYWGEPRNGVNAILPPVSKSAMVASAMDLRLELQPKVEANVATAGQARRLYEACKYLRDVDCVLAVGSRYPELFKGDGDDR
ncbi:MAG: hypothetical protein KF764_34480 [Labilithrix sp.]|nr:hypothetical protein [Labilithrix sp.]